MEYWCYNAQEKYYETQFQLLHFHILNQIFRFNFLSRNITFVVASHLINKILKFFLTLLCKISYYNLFYYVRNNRTLSRRILQARKFFFTILLWYVVWSSRMTKSWDIHQFKIAYVCKYVCEYLVFFFRIWEKKTDQCQDSLVLCERIELNSVLSFTRNKKNRNKKNISEKICTKF